MLIKYEDFLKETNLLRSDGFPLSNVTVNKHFSTINNHFPRFSGLNNWDSIKTLLSDPTKTCKLIDEYPESVSVKSAILDALYHICRNPEYTLMRKKYEEMKTVESLKKEEIEYFDWEAKLADLKEKSSLSRHDYQNYVIGSLMYYHPRRRGDYASLRVVRGSNGAEIPDGNYYFLEENRFLINSFKNSESLTAGEKEFKCHPDLVDILDVWLSKYNLTENMFFGKRGGRLDEDYFSKIVNKAGLPPTTKNRAQQSSLEAEREGSDLLAIAHKFNHSVATHHLSYKKRVTGTPPGQEVADVPELSLPSDDQQCKVKIILRPVMFSYEKFHELVGTSESSSRQIYEYCYNLYKEIKGGPSKGPLRLVDLCNFYNRHDELKEYLCRGRNTVSSLRVYFYRLALFTKSLGINFDPYSQLFNYYDGLCKSRNNRELVDNEYWNNLNQEVDKQLQLINLDDYNSDDRRTILNWRNLAVMVLTLKLPTRKGCDYRSIKNIDDGVNHYYNNGKLFYRSKIEVVEVPIPSKYLLFMERYHSLASSISEYLLFTDIGYKMFKMTNFSNLCKDLLGIDMRAARSKWQELSSKYKLAERRRILVEMG